MMHTSPRLEASGTMNLKGKGVANPSATAFSTAIDLRHSLGQGDAATGIERVVAAVLYRGPQTAGIASPISTPRMTGEFTQAGAESRSFDNWACSGAGSHSSAGR
jgi:isocitrate/isopropylmalate dehydrogenase